MQKPGELMILSEAYIVSRFVSGSYHENKVSVVMHTNGVRSTMFLVTLFMLSRSCSNKQGQISCSTNQRICLHFRSQLIIMQETRNLHQGELENIAVFSGFREIQF